MSQRIIALDYVRVIAVFMILLCHYFLFSDLNSGVGRYLAGSGNIVFFLVSAFLYGQKYNSVSQKNSDGSVNGGQVFDCQSFVFSRIAKLAASVWPFLVVVISLYIAMEIEFSWKDVGLNFLFLGYLGELPGNGHLWFLTILILCYIEIIFFEKFRLKRGYVPWFLLLLSILVVVIGEKIGIPSGALLVFGLFAFIYLKSEWYREKSKAMQWWMAIAIVVINVVTFIIEYNGLFEKSRIIHFLLTGLCGLSLLSLMLRYLPNKKVRIVSFLSGISFEIYIVHHTLCSGPFVRITSWTCGHVLNFIIMFFLSVILAVVLNFIAKHVGSFVSGRILRY